MTSGWIFVAVAGGLQYHSLASQYHSTPVPQHTTNSSYIILPKLRWPPGVLPSSLSVLLGGCWAVTMLAQTPTSESWVVGVSLHSWWHGRRESPLYCGKADQFVVSTATVLATWVVSRHRGYLGAMAGCLWYWGAVVLVRSVCIRE
jgi:hypothetical protein